MRFPPLPLCFETERLMLTPEVLDDADWLATLLTSRGDGDVSREDAASRILTMQTLVTEHGIGARVLRTEPGGAALGYCAIIIGRGSLDEPELAYELLPEARGHGYATEGARALLAAAFGTGRSRIWATVRDWNEPSVRVLARLGFQRDRSTRDARGELVWFVAGPGTRSTEGREPA